MEWSYSPSPSRDIVIKHVSGDKAYMVGVSSETNCIHLAYYERDEAIPHKVQLEKDGWTEHWQKVPPGSQSDNGNSWVWRGSDVPQLVLCSVMTTETTSNRDKVVALDAEVEHMLIETMEGFGLRLPGGQNDYTIRQPQTTRSLADALLGCRQPV